MKRQMSSQARAAKMIRQELKEAFPKTKFSVTSESFSMGDAVRIGWANGPTTEQVQLITSKYQYGHFDGMIDYYEHSNVRDDLPQSKYVQTSREVTEDIQIKVAQLAHGEYQDLCELKKPESVEDLGQSFRFCQQWFNWYDVAWKFTSGVDLTDAVDFKFAEDHSGSVFGGLEVIKQ